MIFSYTLLVKMLYIKGICKGTSRIIFFNENFVHFQFKFCFKKVVQMTSFFVWKLLEPLATLFLQKQLNLFHFVKNLL